MTRVDALESGCIVWTSYPFAMAVRDLTTDPSGVVDSRLRRRQLDFCLPALGERIDAPTVGSSLANIVTVVCSRRHGVGTLAPPADPSC